ncbi:MAG TPA: fasciclin domain-containing protein [Brevundimonas sp.]
MRWAAAAAVLGLAACGGGDDEKATAPGEAAAPSNRTLAASVADSGELGALERVLANAGLNTVLEGTGPYTVFAPNDAAFTAAGGADLGTEAMKAQAAALLRAHIVPGALTRADIEAAMARGGSGTVEMRTMANTLLTFSREGEAIVVAGEGGARGRLAGQETVASNGVVQPVDGVLARGA